jgi:hypothetical protein
LKKRSKKLLAIVGLGPAVAPTPRRRGFFAAFFSKKPALSSVSTPHRRLRGEDFNAAFDDQA